ncbi:MAG: outer membrane lipoprotein-sorting protein [Pseudomonadota bacterium]
MRNVLSLFVLGLTIKSSAYAFVTHIAVENAAPDLKACIALLEEITQIEQQIAFTTYDGEQTTGHSSVDVYWKRFAEDDSRVLIEVNAPLARRGVKLLVMEQDQMPPGLHMYLPELRNVRRVTGDTLSGTLLGSDFNYEDFLYLYGLSESPTIRGEATHKLFNREVFVIEIDPQDENSRYSKIRTFVDEQSCVPLKIDFYSTEGTLRKTLTVDPEKITTIANIHMPISFEMHDVQQDTRTVVTIESVKFDTPLKDSLFSLSGLR